MSEFTVRTPAQLPILLQAFRKDAGLTQKETALHLGITQQTLSALERNAQMASVERLLKYLSLMDVELVLRKRVKPATVITIDTW